VFDLSSVTDDCPSCLCGDKKSLLVVFKEHAAVCFDLSNGEAQFTINCSDEIEFKSPGLSAGEL